MNIFSNFLAKKKYFSFKPFDLNTENGRSSERYRKMILSSFASICSNGIGLAVNFIMVPLTYAYLGKEGFGLWMAISSLIMVLSFTDLGLGNNLLNEVAYGSGEEDIKHIRSSVTNTLIPLIFVSLLLVLLMLVGNSQVNWINFFKLTEHASINEINKSVLTFVTIFIIGLPIKIINPVNDGFQEGYVNNFWQSIGNIFGLLNLFLCVRFQQGLPYLILAYSGTQLLATIMNFSVGVIRKPFIRPSYKYIDFRKIKYMLKSGFVFFLLGFFTLAGLQVDNIIIANKLGADYVASYSILQKLVMLTFIVMVFIQSLWPAYAEAISRNDINWVQKTIKRMLKYSLLGGILFALSFYIFGPFVIEIWVRHDLQISKSLLLGFSFYSLIWILVGNVAVILNSGKFLKFQLMILSTTAVIAILLKLYLIKSFGISIIIWLTNFTFLFFFIIPAYFFIKNKYFKGSYYV